jgi:hypothetical protein
MGARRRRGAPSGAVIGVALVVSIEPMVVGPSARANAEAAVEAGGRSVRKDDGRVELLVLLLLELVERRQASIQSWLGGLSCSSSCSSSSSSSSPSASSSSSEL